MMPTWKRSKKNQGYKAKARRQSALERLKVNYADNNKWLKEAKRMKAIPEPGIALRNHIDFIDRHTPNILKSMERQEREIAILETRI